MKRCLSLTVEVRRDKLKIYEKIKLNVLFMAEPADEVTVPPESIAHTALGMNITNIP